MMNNEVPEDEVHSTLTSPLAAREDNQKMEQELENTQADREENQLPKETSDPVGAIPAEPTEHAVKATVLDTPVSTAEQVVQPSHVHISARESSGDTSPAPDSGDDDADAGQEQEIEFEFGRYIGQVDPLTGLRHGQGTLYYNSGNTYSGEWMNGMAHGFGEKTYKNGDVYRGMWAEGKRCGRGSYLHKEGHFFEGMYENDQPNGYGMLKTVTGDQYTGTWKDGLKSGKGRESLSSGQVFVGKWKNGKKQGRGKLFVPGTNRFIHGVWNENKFFRELTPEEMLAATEEEEQEGDETLPGTSATAHFQQGEDNSNDISSFADNLSEKAMKGVEMLENKLEAWGRALERASLGLDEPTEEEIKTAADTKKEEEGNGPTAQNMSW